MDVVTVLGQFLMEKGGSPPPSRFVAEQLTEEKNNPIPIPQYRLTAPRCYIHLEKYLIYLPALCASCLKSRKYPKSLRLSYLKPFCMIWAGFDVGLTWGKMVLLLFPTSDLSSLDVCIRIHLETTQNCKTSCHQITISLTKRNP